MLEELLEQEATSQSLADYVDINNGRGLLIKNAVLMSEGIWNNIHWTKEEIKKAFENTNWSDRSNKNVFLDHKEEADEWIGEVENLRFENDTLYGDIRISDPVWAVKLKHGKPKVGISPRVVGNYDEDTKTMKDFTFKHFAMVINPAVKTAWINNMEVLAMEDITEKNLEAEIEDELKKEKLEDEESEKTEDAAKKKKKQYPEPYASEKAILEAAKEILKKKKKKYPYPYEEEDKDGKLSSAIEEALEDLMDLFELFDLKKKSIAEIVRKAKKIRKKGESWKAAIKRAAKLQETEETESTEEESTESTEETKTEETTEAETKDEKMESKELSEKPDAIELQKIKDLAESGDPDKGMLVYLKKMLEKEEGR